MLTAINFLDTKNCHILSQYHHPDGNITAKVLYKGVKYNVLYTDEGKLIATPVQG